jgi:asparagine synthase (glutamine-hydrolysing)
MVVCGIAGFAGIDIADESPRVRLERMCGAIYHRGPDSAGYFVQPGIAMGMRRLSIIDISGGQQPICNEDGTVTVVFNGEIYNHHELRARLERAGHRFSTHSDTEVLVHLYEDHGLDMVAQLHGMFAFSIWDATKGRLLIARDRTGMKPLSYFEHDGGIEFCSELRSLCAADSSALRILPAAVMQYLAFGYVPDPLTIFSGVRKLPPGHLLTWSAAAGISVRRYWQVPAPSETKLSMEDLIDSIRLKLDKAVASHLESEVPLGAFLSGGLDSSTVVALMRKHASGRVRTFTIGFAEEEYDESVGARSVSSELGTEHTELIVKPDVEALFDVVATMFDEPFADSSAIATFLVAQLAKEQVTVVLSGDGGDELFGGYARYQSLLARGPGPNGVLRSSIGKAALRLPHMFPWRNKLIDLGRSRWGQYAATVAQPIRRQEGGVAAHMYAAKAASIDEQLQEQLAAVGGWDFAAAMMQVDIGTYLPGDILTKVDRTTMAVSLEARVPLLDAELVDFALRIPGHLRVTATENKRLFRCAIKDIVPASVLSRPKRGFEVPLGRWFRGPLRHRIQALRIMPEEMSEFVDQESINRLIWEHLFGRRDHSTVLWRVLVLQRWLGAISEGAFKRPPAVHARL